MAKELGILPLQNNWQRLSRNLTDIICLNDEEKIAAIRDYTVPAFVIISTARVLCDASRRRFSWGMEVPCHGSLLQSGEGVR